MRREQICDEQRKKWKPRHGKSCHLSSDSSNPCWNGCLSDAVAAAEPEITGTFIDSKLEAAGELTSAKMIYNGLIHYSDGSIPFLTQKAFNMTYRAEVRAGVDLSKANTEVTDSEVTVTLPAVEIFDISIDNDSIQYYDEKAALLNWERKEDVLDAIASAKEQQTKEMDDLETMAQEQAKTLITGMLSETVGDKTLVVKFEE